MSLRRLRCVNIAFGPILAFILLPPNTSAQGNYNFVNIDYPNSITSYPSGINDNGQIVGSWEDAHAAMHGYLYNNGVFTSLDYPGANNTEAVGINNAGVISGYYMVNGSSVQGFVYSNGTFTPIAYPGSTATQGESINNNGSVVGFYNFGLNGFIDTNGAFTSFAYPGAATTFAYGINDFGQISGYYALTSRGAPSGFFYDGVSNFTSISYPGASQTYVNGINNSQVVVGNAIPPPGSGQPIGFLWVGGQFTVVNPPSSSPLPSGINNKGQIVGVYFPVVGELRHGFLGTPPAPAPAVQFVSATPCRLVDTRQSGGPIQGGTSRDYTIPQLGPCNIPSSAAAYSLNITAVPHGPLGYLTIWPTGESQPTTSLLNSLDGRIKANAAIVPAGSGGTVSVFVSNTSDVVIDINGYFVSPNSNTLEFYPLLPCRVIDTRGPNGSLGGPFLTGGVERDFPVPESGCLPLGSGAQAYSLNFTVVPHPAGNPLGYLTVWPNGGSLPTVSTLNNLTATVVANAAIVPAGANGAISTFASNDTDLVVDINGYFAAPQTGGLSLYGLAPCRVLDTRQVGSGQPFTGELTVDVLSNACQPSMSAQAYVFNATVVPSGPLGYLTLWSNGLSQPVVSTLNALDGFVTSNMAIVPTTNGEIDAFASNPTQLVLDLYGYFAP